MRRTREFTEGAFYHVTSRTNDKIRVFENKLGRKIMLMTLQDAKAKYHFTLANFCIMPTHFHLLIQPFEGTSLSRIMQWIKTNSAKTWNRIHGSIDHLWGERYFAQAVNSQEKFDIIMDYIDNNPVVVGLAPTPEDWKASGAFYKSRNIQGLVDFSPHNRKKNIKLLSPIPPLVSRLLPPAQLARITQYYGAYAEAVDRFYNIIQQIPDTPDPTGIYLRYYTGAADYFINGYDGEDTLWGKVRLNVFPYKTEYQTFNISDLKNNRLMELDLNWVVTTISY